MSNFWQRALFGALFVAVIISAVFAGEYCLLALLMLIGLLGLNEFYSLCEKGGVRPQKVAGIILGVSPFTAAFISSNEFAGKYSLCLVFLLPFLIFFFELFRKSDKPFANIAFTFLGILYIAAPLFLFYLISLINFNPTVKFELFKYHAHNLLGYFFILWSYDTGAYLVGRKLGKHKLFERISPNKSWEGAIGGTIIAVLISYVVSIYFTEFRRMDWIIISLIIVITGTLGDLVESMFKRSINIKDSGSILPGHGGILDRFDALFLSAPFVLFYLYLATIS